MTYDCIHGRSPVYFRDICSPIVSVPFRSRLRSADNDDMIVPRTRTARYGPRSFRVAAPRIWSMLPPHLKNSNVKARSHWRHVERIHVEFYIEGIFLHVVCRRVKATGEIVAELNISGKR